MAYDDFTHGFCDICRTIRPVIRSDFEVVEPSGKFLAGEFVCRTCRSLVAMLYKAELKAELE
jgi:hypothetical protein